MAKSFRGDLAALFGWAAFFAIVSCQPARAAVSLPHVNFHTLTLANGLHAVFAERHESPVVTVEVWYHVGSKNEVPGKTGFAHLFEHLMFDGTKDLPADQFSNYIIGSGGVDNAYTTVDATVFWETIPSSALAIDLWLEADRMRNLDITQKTFNNEREVVEEERRLRFDNPPYGTVIEKLYQHAFTVHPYHHLPIGSMEDLDHASVEDVRTFYDKYYVPDNATVVVVGDFSTANAEQIVKEYFGPLAPGTNPIPRQIPQEPRQTAERIVRIPEDVALPAFVEGYHMPADGTPDAYPLELASKILSEGESSKIYRRLVYQKQMALEAQSTGNFTEDSNLFFVFAVMDSGHTPAEGEAAVGSVLDEVKAEPVSERELERAKNQILYEYAEGLETSRSEAEELGYASVILNDPELINTEVLRFLAVTPQDILDVARKYFVARNLTLIEVYPGGSGSGSAPSAPRGQRQ